MSTTLDPLGDPLGDPLADPALAELRTAFLRARARDTTVRLSLAMFRARGYAQVWGRDDEARRWSSTAEQLRSELDELDRRIADATTGTREAGAARLVDAPRESTGDGTDPFVDASRESTGDGTEPSERSAHHSDGSARPLV